MKAEAPFLLFRADAKIKLIFCAPTEMAPEDIQSQSNLCLTALKRKMGDGWDDNRPENSLATVLASSLDGLLDDKWSDLSLYGKNHPLFSYLPGFMNERDIEEKRRILFEYPDLLGQSSLKLLGHFIVTSEQKGDVARAQDLREQKRLLERCTEVGVEAAFAEAARQRAGALHLLSNLHPQ